MSSRVKYVWKRHAAQNCIRSEIQKPFNKFGFYFPISHQNERNHSYKICYQRHNGYIYYCSTHLTQSHSSFDSSSGNNAAPKADAKTVDMIIAHPVGIFENISI